MILRFTMAEMWLEEGCLVNWLLVNKIINLRKSGAEGEILTPL